MHIRTHARARRNISDGISLLRPATRPIQSRPNRKMSRNVGNWKAYSYFFFRYAPGIRADIADRRPYFHFACLTRGATLLLHYCRRHHHHHHRHPPPLRVTPPSPLAQGTRKGGGCRKGAADGCCRVQGWSKEGGEAGRNARADCAGKCKTGG